MRDYIHRQISQADRVSGRTARGAPLLLSAFIALSSLTLPIPSQAASSFISGGQSATINCYRSAKLASKPGKKVSRFRTFARTDACDKALEHYQLTSKQRAAVHLNRGIIQTAAGALNQAVEDYDEAIRLHPNLPEAYLSRGNALFMIGYYQQALNEYELAIAKAKENQRPKRKATKVTHGSERNASSLATAFVWNQPIAYFNRGLALQKLKRYREALRDFQKAKELSGDELYILFPDIDLRLQLVERKLARQTS